MLTPAPMLRVEFLVLDRDLESLSAEVGREGALHPIDVSELGAWAGRLVWSEMDGLAAEYGSTERRLSRVQQFLRLNHSEVDLQVRVSPREVLAEARGLLDQVEPEIRGQETRLRDLETRRRRLEGLSGILAMLVGLDIDLALLRNLSFLYLAVGLMPPENLQRLDESLRDVVHVLIPVRRVGDRLLLFAWSKREDSHILDRALQSAYVERLEIPAELSGTPAQAQAQLGVWLGQLERDTEEVERQRGLLRDRWGDEIGGLGAAIEANSQVVAFWQKAGRTERTRLLAGWVPGDRFDEFVAGVGEATGGRSVVARREPSPEEDGAAPHVPTALRNPPFLRPFEVLTRTYGLPDYWDLDPTPVAAVLYVVMFGAMFGDLGQGAVLASLGAVLAMGWIVPGQGDFGRVLAASGASAMLFGLLYGSVFATEGLIPALWFRPMSNPLFLIAVAVAFGVVVLSMGLIFGIATAWRRRDRMALYLGQSGLVGIWLYWGLLAVAALAALGYRQILVAAIPLIGVPVVAIFLHGPIAHALGWEEQGGDGAYVIQSGVETFDLVVRFASNTVSFLRLGAFALGHVGLGVTIFALAELVRGLPGAFLATIVVGNLVIIVLEALIVGIQALRLEYYEFFTKFLRGGGMAYRPFALSSRVVVSADEQREE